VHNNIDLAYDGQNGQMQLSIHTGDKVDHEIFTTMEGMKQM
jgi:hypothetical protein